MKLGMGEVFMVPDKCFFWPQCPVVDQGQGENGPSFDILLLHTRIFQKQTYCIVVI